MFDNILKITLFEAELLIKVVSFCVQDQLVPKIKIQDHPLTRFDALSKSQNEFPLEIMFFEVSSFISICVKL